MRISIIFLLFVAVYPFDARSQTASTAHWGALDRLIGSWVSDPGSGGAPGQATKGGETWSHDLNNDILVRRDFSEYPKSSGRTVLRHEGLMVVAPNMQQSYTAHYYDNEGHTIAYLVAASDTAIVFTSNPIPNAPQFRLTYRPIGAAYEETFEIAGPNQPGMFHPYVKGVIRRSKARTMKIGK